MSDLRPLMALVEAVPDHWDSPAEAQRWLAAVAACITFARPLPPSASGLELGLFGPDDRLRELMLSMRVRQLRRSLSQKFPGLHVGADDPDVLEAANFLIGLAHRVAQQLSADDDEAIGPSYELLLQLGPDEATSGDEAVDSSEASRD